LRKGWRQYGDIPLRVIYHPSYLLRQRDAEGGKTKADAETWRDILDIMEKASAIRGAR
jgi:uracil-DNA glycosylase